ncbi:MAG: hypothetical protein R3F61_17400 [Myxococcota bacterium]
MTHLLALSWASGLAQPVPAGLPAIQRAMDPWNRDWTCAADRVFIGTVVTADTHRSDTRVGVVTDVVFRVERDLVGGGPTPETFPWTMPGGRLVDEDGSFLGTRVAGFPHVERGLRLLVAFRTQGPALQDGPRLHGFQPVPDGPLATPATLREAWEDGCGPH